MRSNSGHPLSSKADKPTYPGSHAADHTVAYLQLIRSGEYRGGNTPGSSIPGASPTVCCSAHTADQLLFLPFLTFTPAEGPLLLTNPVRTTSSSPPPLHLISSSCEQTTNSLLRGSTSRLFCLSEECLGSVNILHLSALLKSLFQFTTRYFFGILNYELLVLA